MLTIWLLTTAVGRLAGAASGLADFAASNSDKAAQVQLPPALQQQIDQLKAQGRAPTRLQCKLNKGRRRRKRQFSNPATNQSNEQRISCGLR